MKFDFISFIGEFNKEVFGMAHSYICCHIHYIFSTKNRVKIITPELEERLWPYMGGIAREHKMSALAIGGCEDHAHLLISLPSTLSIAKAIQLIKGGSSTWVHQTFPGHKDFEWQEGYGAFSVSISHIDKTIAYIHKQKEHHKTQTFQEEYLAFLDKHGIAYDERYVWG
ncbi:MAG: IS200/IS605 family transposase [Calditrichia bacterium]|nr:IS200/IS605 family transposase [Calditrichia bacterium]